MAITFMARFDERGGSSCHIHLSLEEARTRPAEAFDSFVAGHPACLRKLTLFYAPNVNSYQRYQPGSFAPTAVRWGRDNRTCAMRVVGEGPSKRVENRVPEADVNPYLALPAMVAAGLHGTEQGLE